jgi:hypothetical protein
LSADAIARTSSRHVSTAPTKTACIVVTSRRTSVAAVAARCVVHSSEHTAHRT